jgi:hypothetical protein
MFSEESLWSFLKLLFVIHKNNKWYKSGFPRRQEQLANKNWRYSAVRQTTGTLAVYS